MSLLRDNVNMGPKSLRVQMKSFVTCAGVFNGISAVLAERAGFNALYLSGSGVAGVMGLPDISVTTLSEVAEEVRRITAVSRSPLIVDADTGFGEAVNVMRTVRVLESAGASGIHIEDQVLPKRCGHLDGKTIVGPDDMAKKILAAVQARKNSDFQIIARTDARSVGGLEDAIERAKVYLEAGADVIFTEALESKAEFERFAREVKAPLLANMTEFGKSPLLSAEELQSIGYRMVIFPLTAFRAALKTIYGTYQELYRKGTQSGFISSLMDRKEYYEVIGYSDYAKEDLELSRGGR